VRLPHPRRTRDLFTCLAGGFMAASMAGCTPTVKVEAPDKPIVINLNVKIEQEVRVKVDRDVDTLLQNNPDLF
jgi:hypothetical protein